MLKSQNKKQQIQKQIKPQPLGLSISKQQQKFDSFIFKKYTQWKSITNNIQKAEGVNLLESNFDFQSDFNFKSYANVDGIFPAYENTFIIQFSNDKNRGSKVAHYTSSGVLLRFLYYERSDIKVELISSKIVIIYILERRTNEVTLCQWDIENYQTMTISTSINNYNQSKLLVFSKSKVFCLCQKQREGQLININLTYYKYPLKPNLNNIINKTTKKLKLSQYNYQSLNCIPLNDVSMIGILSLDYVQNQKNQILCYSYKNKQQNGWKVYKFTNKFHKYSKICLVRIQDIWEITTGSFYLHLKTKINLEKIDYEEQPDKYDQQSTQQIEKNHSFIWQYEIGRYKPTKFTIDEDHNTQIAGLDRLIEQLKYFIRFRGDIFLKNFKNNFLKLIYKIVPTYYIDLRTQKIIVNIQPHTSQIEPPLIQSISRSYSSHAPQLQTLYHISGRGKVNIWVRKIQWLQFSKQQVTAFFLMDMMIRQGLLEGCDENLLMESSDLLKSALKSYLMVNSQQK